MKCSGHFLQYTQGIYRSAGVSNRATDVNSAVGRVTFSSSEPSPWRRYRTRLQVGVVNRIYILLA